MQTTKHFKLQQSLSEQCLKLLEISMNLQISSRVSNLRYSLVSKIIESLTEKPSKVAQGIVSEIATTYIEDFKALNGGQFGSTLAPIL